MAVREYIGARYIPLFADPLEWDINTEYEPLTVVKNQGNSYVSRQAVPEGIQLDNIDYWVKWADYNAQLQTYINQVEAFDGRIDALEDGLPVADFDSDHTVSDALSAINDLLPAASFDSVNTVDARFDALEDLLPAASFDSVNTVDARFDALEDLLPAASFDSINTVDARFDAIETNGWVTTDRIADDSVTRGKLADNVVLIGDSWGAGWTPDGNVTSWITHVTNYLEDLGITVYSHSEGGIGIVTNGGWIPVIQTLAGTMTQKQRESVGTLLIGAGWNDNGHTLTSDYVTPINDLCTAVETYFPNADFIYDWIGNGLATNASSAAGASRMGNAFAAASAANEYTNKMRLVYGLETLMSTAYFASDGYHPNTAGSQWLAKHVIGTLRGINVFVPQTGGVINLNSTGTTSDLKIVINNTNGTQYTNSHSKNSYTGYISGNCTWTTAIAKTFNKSNISFDNVSGEGCNLIMAPWSFESAFVVMITDHGEANYGNYRTIPMLVHCYRSQTGFAVGLYANATNGNGTNYLSGNVKQLQAQL